MFKCFRAMAAVKDASVEAIVAAETMKKVAVASTTMMMNIVDTIIMKTAIVVENIKAKETTVARVTKNILVSVPTQ